MSTNFTPDDAMDPELDIPAVTLLGWVYGDDEHHAYHAARHPNLLGEVLTLLSKSPRDMVRKGVLGNPSTPPEVLLNMLHDPNLHPWFDLYLELAMNPSAPLECYMAVIEHGDEEARAMLALNRSCDRATLEILARDEDESVAEEARSVLEAADKLYGRGHLLRA